MACCREEFTFLFYILLRDFLALVQRLLHQHDVCCVFRPAATRGASVTSGAAHLRTHDPNGDRSESDRGWSVWQSAVSQPQVIRSRSSLLTATNQLRTNKKSQQPAIHPYPQPDEFSPNPLPIYSSLILILCSHLRLGLPSGLPPSGFHIKIPYAFLFCPHLCTASSGKINTNTRLTLTP